MPRHRVHPLPQGERGRKPGLRSRLIYPTGKSMRPALERLSSPSRKNILLFRNRKSVYIHGHPASQEGRFAVVTDVDAGCDGRGSVTRRMTVPRTEKPCGPDAPTLASSSRKAIFAGDGGKKARSPGRARRKPLKPLRGECR